MVRVTVMSRRRARGERGGVMLLSILVVTPLLTISALVLDVGNAYQHRRRAQNAVDSAAMAAARDLPNETYAADVVATAKSFALQNHGTPTAAWVGCVDGEALAVKPDLAANGNSCISYNARVNAVRVKLPKVAVATGFGKIIGVDDITVSASAGAGLRLRMPGGVLPFGLPSGSAEDVALCLKTGSGGHSPNQPPCDGPDDGNFGSLDIPFHGSPQLQTPTQCTGNTNGRLEVNIALGADHALAPYPSGGLLRYDTTQCPVDNPPPNQLASQTGIGSNLDNGLALGTTLPNGTAVPGRLADTPYAKRTVRTGRPQLDDKPLWEFIDPSLTSPLVPATCQRSSISDKVEMETCLLDYLTGSYTTPLFSVDTDSGDDVFDIQNSPRFGWVPQLWETQWESGSGRYEIKSFRPVFIQTTYFSCTANVCDVVFDPGEPGIGIPGASNDSLQAVGAFLLPDGALPAAMSDEGPNSDGRWEVVLTD